MKITQKTPTQSHFIAKQWRELRNLNQLMRFFFGLVSDMVAIFG